MLKKEVLSNILLHAKLASCTYKDSHQNIKELEGLNLIKVTEKDTGCVWVLNDDQDNLYIAFRGSDSVKDLLNNINMKPSPFYNNMGDVHFGYLEYYKCYRNRLVEYIFKLKAKGKLNNISICGHSAGGCESDLAAADFAFLLKENVTSYTFGSPPVGDETFSKCVDSLPNLKSYRILHEDDFVKSIPTPYVHVQKTPILIKENRHHNDMKLKIHPTTIIRNHSMQTYIKGVKRLLI